MNKHRSFMALLLVVGLTVAVAGCKGGKKDQDDVIPQPQEPAAPPAEEVVETEPPVEVTRGWEQEEPVVQEEADQTAADWNRQGVLQTVYFEFDRSDLSDETRALLRANAEWMRAHPEFGVVIEGHCDERGTIEYNLALGQRRARAVSDYLTSLGVRGARLRTRTFGEERPAVTGHDEAAWSRNRRAEFVIE